MASKGQLTVRIIGDAKSFNDTLSGMGDDVKKWGSALPAVAGAALLGAGVAIGGTLVKGFMDALDQDAASDSLAARFGMSEREARELGKAAADVYTDAWGDSVGQVTAVIGDLREELGELGPEAARRLSTAALAIQQVFGQDTTATIDAVSQMLTSGLADSAEEAFDIIARGLQEGANKRDDFLGTLVEYSDAYRTLGLDAETATGLIIAGLEGGAFSADKVGDAINEFATRAVDGSETTRRAFDLIGLDADDMAAKIAEGGPTAREALSEIIGALGDVGDAVAQDEAGVGLFGSMWEDVGKDAILALDPINGALTNVEGTVDRVTTKAGDNVKTRLTDTWRDFTQSVPQAIIDSGMLDSIDNILDALDKEGLAGAMEQVQLEWEKALPQIQAWWEGSFQPWWEDVAVPWMAYIGGEMGIALVNALVEALVDGIKNQFAEGGPIGMLVNDVWSKVGDLVGVDAPQFRIPLPDYEVPDMANPFPRPEAPPPPVNNPDRHDIGGGRTMGGASVYSPTVINYNPTPEPASTTVESLRRLELARR